MERTSNFFNNEKQILIALVEIKLDIKLLIKLEIN